MRYVGLDVHSKAVVFAIVGEDGNVVKRGEFTCDRAALSRFAEKVLHNDDHVAVEATTKRAGRHLWSPSGHG